jgi:hypothetical protein
MASSRRRRRVSIVVRPAFFGHLRTIASEKNTEKENENKSSKFEDKFSLAFLATLVTGEFRETAERKTRAKTTTTIERTTEILATQRSKCSWSLGQTMPLTPGLPTPVTLATLLQVTLGYMYSSSLFSHQNFASCSCFFQMYHPRS